MTSAAHSAPGADPAGLILVCEEPRRGQALLVHLRRAGTVLRSLDAAKASGRVVFWVQRPVRWVTLRDQLRAAHPARAAVVCHPQQAATIELALREGASVITSPDPQSPLPDKLRAWLERPDEGRLVAPNELAERMTRALERRLRRSSPAVRVADTGRVEALAEKLAAQVLREARGLEGASVRALDWEHETTAVQSREDSVRFRQMAADSPDNREIEPSGLRMLPLPLRLEPSHLALRPAPRDPELLETGPFAALEPETEVDEDEDEDEAPTMAKSEAPPRRPAAPSPGVPPAVVIAVMCLMGAVGGFGATMVFKDRLIGTEWVAPTVTRAAEPSVPAPSSPPAGATSPPSARPPELPPDPTPALGSADAPEPSPVAAAPARVATAPARPTRRERGHRALQLAEHHRASGRLERARLYAARAARLAPDEARGPELLEAIDAELAMLAAEDAPVEIAASDEPDAEPEAELEPSI